MKTNSLLILLLLIISSCGHEKPKGKTEAEVLFKEAKLLMDDGQYLLATQKLNELKNRYPYSFYATPSELLQADILFLQESYVESAAAYMLFRDLHPKHVQLDYVIFKIAESYFKQIPDTHDRDLTAAHEAIKYFKEMLNKYPESEYNKNANEKMKYSWDMLLRKEQYIADFYYKTEVFEAAKWRYLDILKNYQNKKLRQHSILMAMKSAMELKEFSDCQNIYLKYKTEIAGNRQAELGKLNDQCSKKKM